MDIGAFENLMSVKTARKAFVKAALGWMLLIGTLLVIPETEALEKVKGAYPIAGSNINSRIRGLLLTPSTKPGETAKVSYPRGDYMKTWWEKNLRVAKKKAEKPVVQSQPKRYELKHLVRHQGIRPFRADDPLQRNISHYWVSPLPESGHSYLESMYKN